MNYEFSTHVVYVNIDTRRKFAYVMASCLSLQLIGRKGKSRMFLIGTLQFKLLKWTANKENRKHLHQSNFSIKEFHCNFAINKWQKNIYYLLFGS